MVRRPVAAGTLLFACKSMCPVVEKHRLAKVMLSRLVFCPQAEFENFLSLYDYEARHANIWDKLLGTHSLEAGTPMERPAERKIDEVQVARILERNAHAWDQLNIHGTTSDGQWVGVWPLAAMLNHSDRPNVQRLFLGDLMVCRASVDLPTGSELLDCYTSPFQPLSLRAQQLRQDFGFEPSSPRSILEAALLSPQESVALLERLDTIIDEVSKRPIHSVSQSLAELVNAIDAFVSSSLRHFDQRSREPSLRSACSELWPNETAAIAGVSERLVERVSLLLCGSFLPVFKASAFCTAQMGAASAVAAYERCLAILEEVAPASAYHVHWAGQCARHAAHARAAPDVLSRCVAYAQKWGSRGCGAELFHAMISGALAWPDDLLSLAETEMVSKVPLALGWEHRIEELGTALKVYITIPVHVSPSDVHIDIAAAEVVAAYADSSLQILLPVKTEPSQAPAAKFKKRERQLMLELPKAQTAG